MGANKKAITRNRRIALMGRSRKTRRSPLLMYRLWRKDLSINGPKTMARIMGATSKFNLRRMYPTHPMTIKTIKSTILLLTL
jgi:hypothetical protein